MRRIILLTVALSIPGMSHLTGACTIVMLTNGETVLVGNNEDYTYLFTSVWFIPASGDSYGRICFGFNFGEDNLAATGGMNDQGLFIDGNGLGATGWVPEQEKETFDGIVEAHVLARYATVEEALSFFENVNVSLLARGKFLIADASGASAVVEWGGGKLQFIRRSGNYQISTNFVQSDHRRGHYPCYRYNTAEKIIKEADEFSVELIRSILSATHFEGTGSNTLFSNIYDLRKGNVYVYNFHNFEDVVTFHLEDELKKGERDYFLPSLFSRIPYAQHLFIPRATKPLLKQALDKGDPETFLTKFHETRQFCLAAFDRDYSERIVNSLGYDLLRDNRVTDAIKVFTFNVTEYPESANAYDSLGEAYMIHGDRELAIRNYRKSLEQDPGNTNARDMLNRLDEKK